MDVMVIGSGSSSATDLPVLQMPDLFAVAGVLALILLLVAMLAEQPAGSAARVGSADRQPDSDAGLRAGGSKDSRAVHRSFAQRSQDAPMTLSEDEQNCLDRIENSLAAEDPGFAGRLDVEAVQRLLERRIRIASYGFWSGLVVTVVGAGTARGVLSIGAMAGCYGCALLVWSAMTLLRYRDTAHPRTDSEGPAT